MTLQNSFKQRVLFTLTGLCVTALTPAITHADATLDREFELALTYYRISGDYDYLTEQQKRQFIRYRSTYSTRVSMVGLLRSWEAAHDRSEASASGGITLRDALHGQGSTERARAGDDIEISPSQEASIRRTLRERRINVDVGDLTNNQKLRILSLSAAIHPRSAYMQVIRNP